MKIKDMKQKIFYLKGFKLKYILRRGFWRLLWFGIVANFNIIIVTKDETADELFSIGTFTPIQKWWDNGYSVKCGGFVFGFPIILYYK
jgi:hypothetical protein